MPQFLYRIQPIRLEELSEGSTEPEKKAASDHFNYLKDLMEKGVVILAGRTLNKDHGTFGIIIFNAESEDEARRVMHSDPAVKGKVFRAELYPYDISLLKAENA